MLWWWFWVSVLVVIPLWRVFRRAGFNPAWSLIVLIPWVGGPVALAILALAPWPVQDARGSLP
ncbi:MAG: hypothetical protein H3C38_16515 [Rhodospirillales bacterium]|nr:hypothetical protein [Rhodospirillales bacterium]